MYVLDLETLVWRRVEEKGVWPCARYFHTLDHWDGKLVLWGGMGTAGDGAGCVLGDLWVFDVVRGVWDELAKQGARARYAHLSAVVGERLIVMGGQEITNE